MLLVHVWGVLVKGKKTGVAEKEGEIEMNLINVIVFSESVFKRDSRKASILSNAALEGNSICPGRPVPRLETGEPDTILPTSVTNFLAGNEVWGKRTTVLSFIFALAQPGIPIGSQVKPHLFQQRLPLPVWGARATWKFSFSFFLSGCLWWCSDPLKGVWSLLDTHICLKIYIFDFLAHFLTAYIKENCKCLEKSKFFSDTCSSTKFVFTNSGKEDADERRWKYLVIFLLKSSKLYFLSLLEEFQVLRAIWKLVRPCFLLFLGWDSEGSPLWPCLIEVSIRQGRLRTAATAEPKEGIGPASVRAGAGQLTGHSMPPRLPQHRTSGRTLSLFCHPFLLSLV